MGGGSFLSELAGNNSSELSSAYRSKVDTVNKKIVTLVEKYEKLNAEQQ